MSAPAAAAAAASGSLAGAPSSGAELPDELDSDTDSSSLVDAVQLVQVQRMYARQGLALATSDVGATAPRPEEGETEEEFAASTAPRPGGFRMVAPRITLEQAQAQAKRTCGAGASPVRPRRRLVSVSPEWRAQVLECVREQGFEVAPPDYPIEAAFTMVPDIGLAWIIAATHTHTHTDTADDQH